MSAGGGSRVLVTSAGSSRGLDITRSLRLDPTLEVIGADAGVAGRKFAASICSRVVALPMAAEDPEAYADALDAATADADFLFLSLDVEVEALVAAGRVPACPSSTPFDCAELILDKARTAAHLPAELVPRTVEVAGPSELESAIADVSPPVWLRPAVGTSGQGSLRVDSLDEGRIWMEFWTRRGIEGRWIVQEYLPGPNLNWMGLYREGELLASACMDRLGYLLGKLTASGVTGQVSEGELVDDPEAARVGRETVAALSARPHGVYSVDLCGDAEGRPKVTEVNPCASARPWLYTGAGANLVLAAFRALTGGEIGDAVHPEGPETGVRVHRQVDVAPVFTRPAERES